LLIIAIHNLPFSKLLDPRIGQNALFIISLQRLVSRFDPQDDIPLLHDNVPTSTIQKTGQMVSRLGFGDYRINCRNPHHKEALISAIKQGINVIDTQLHILEEENLK
jgi:hypothetical protein